MKLFLRIGAPLVLFLLAACGTTQVHRLPLGVERAHESFAPIASCAGDAGLQYVEFDDAINVKYDEATWMQYMWSRIAPSTWC